MISWLKGTPSVSVVEQMHVMSKISRQNLETRVAAFLFMTLGLYVVGYTVEAVYFVAGLIVTELMLWNCDRRCADKNREKMRLDVIRFGTTRLVSTLFSMSVGLFAITSPSVSVVVTGFIWIIGLMSFYSIYYARSPLFYPVSILPMGLCVVWSVSTIGDHPLRAATPMEWYLPIFGSILLLQSLVTLIRAQRLNNHELEVARSDAHRRLTELEFAADHDDLTGLLNRAAFNSRLSEQLLTNRIDSQAFALLLLDLDGFKPVNDGFGHPAGDALLVEVSGRLRNAVGRDGIVARVGGDEFGVILQHINQADTLEDVARDLIRVVGLPVKFKDMDLSVGVSVGAVITNADLSTSEKVIAAADEALYEAKENKKSAVVIFRPGMGRRRVPIEERGKIEAAIKKKLIKPFYQPKFCLKTRQVLGFEALARWPLDPSQPSDSAHFVEKIAEMGLLSEFTYQMARQVFTDITTLLDEGYDPGQVSLNLSEVTLATVNGLEDLQWLLAENSRVVPHVTLEITEDVFIARSGARIRESIRELRAIGVRISLDDFGTGFASFQHLRQLEFDELKIDTEFVQGLGIDATANVIVDGFLSIAQGLGVSVVAEGVETEAQRKYLVERGCPVAQGFLHSKAVPLIQAREFLDRPDERAETA